MSDQGERGAEEIAGVTDRRCEHGLFFPVRGTAREDVHGADWLRPPRYAWIADREDAAVLLVDR